MLGNSGATIEFKKDTVTKSGGMQNLNQESYLLSHLGRGVCPGFKGYIQDGYIMERCLPVAPQDIRPLLRRIHELLATKVWNRQPITASVMPVDPTLNWEMHNQERLWQYHPWISQDYAEWVYANDRKQCLTHGDPTIANVVFRGEQLLLCDPVFPRPGYASTRAVDYGKMLQSAAGWEHQLDNAWPVDNGAIRFVVNQLIPLEERRASLFWAAYHCARISHYNKDNKLGEWTRIQSHEFADWLRLAMEGGA